jgi:hypothetical protein
MSNLLSNLKDVGIREAGKWAVVLALLAIGGSALSYYASERTIDRRLEIARDERAREESLYKRQNEDRHEASTADRERTKERQIKDEERITRDEARIARDEEEIRQNARRIAILEKINLDLENQVKALRLELAALKGVPAPNRNR